ncbi:MAG: M1 family aminopeptidase [Planctomycetota bacterium]
MSFGRFGEVYGLDLRHYLRRPIFWIWIVVVVLVAFGMSQGAVKVQSGDADIGGTKAWVSSEFNLSMILGILVPVLYTFFLAVAAGMPLIRADELRVAELLHSTALRPGEYVWAKFLAPLSAALLVLAVHLGAAMLFNHQRADATDWENVGPFALANYLRPALLFAVPTILFVAGVTFAVGEATRRPIVVFALPVALFMSTIYFFWTFGDSSLDPGVDRLLMALDPTGFRWLNRTWLEVDRGVDFFNTAPVGLDPLIVLNRLAFAAAGLLAVAGSHRHFAARRRGRPGPALTRAELGAARPAPAAGSVAPPSFAGLDMRARAVGFLRGAWYVLRVELAELKSQPGLYLFLPLIVADVVNEGFLSTGPLDTKILSTPGLLAMSTLPGLTVLLALLLMFYTIESLRRERATQLAPIYHATPLGSAAIYLGKVAANAILGLVAAAITFLACWAIIAYQGKVPFAATPFLVVWGCLLLPTLVLWCSFVAFLYTLTRSAWTTYGLCLAALIYTGYQLAVGDLTWRWNWPVWSTIGWSDAGVFPLDREALVLNRAMVLAAALFFVVAAVRLFPRREHDPQRVLLALRPRSLARAALLLSPVLVPPLALNLWLDHRIDAGWEGDLARKEQKDYWRKNVATWLDAPGPDIARADVALELDPARRWFRTKGEFALANRTADPLARFCLTSGPHWEELAWTMDGAPYAPEDRTFLHVFTPPEPLLPGGTVTIGFSHHGIVNDGISRNGGGAMEFILPAGVVLTSFSPTFVPTIGFSEEIGIDEENAHESKSYPPDFYAGDTPSFVNGWSPFPVRLEVTAPAEYTINGVGVLEREEVAGGRRTVVWATDHPVQFFNVVAGRWDVRRGEGVAVHHFPSHTYNVDEMVAALEGARRWYSEWFHPFPWQELKISEFPGLAGYAQGFATNIPFSESIGFLTESDEESNAAFFVTAHEAAHQWWGNLLAPGRGPGGNLLSEGTANFASILLFAERKGERARLAFCRQIEDSYARGRVADSERPLVWIDGSRPGDTVVTYDKAGWVYWMLLQRMGREPCLEGMRAFIARYATARDHPVLQDFLAEMREHAPDPAAYDDFVQQWFFTVVVPEYRLADVESAAGADGTWTVTGVLENAGTGRMPVEVAATRGERFPGAEAPPDEAPYAEVRTTLAPGPGERLPFALRCGFAPERVVVDPDVLVLQLNRKLATRDL